MNRLRWLLWFVLVGAFLCNCVIVVAILLGLRGNIFVDTFVIIMAIATAADMLATVRIWPWKKTDERLTRRD
jgi:hypothetical protein